MSERPADRDAARERITEGRAFLGDWRENDNAIAARAHLADALDHLEVALAVEARVVLLEAQLAAREAVILAARVVDALDTKEGAGQDIDGFEWRRAFISLHRALAAVSVADSGPEECQHPSASFDRTICACGSMHHYCDACGKTLDCPLDSGPEEKKP